MSSTLQQVGFAKYESNTITSSRPRPGDVILQVGVTGDSNTLHFSDTGNLMEIVSELQRRLENREEGVQIVILRNGSLQEMYLPLLAFKKLPRYRDPGHLAQCQLKEGPPELFAELAESFLQERATMARTQLSRATVTFETVPEVASSAMKVLCVMFYPVKDARTGQYHDVVHTGTRAINWMSQAQASGSAINLISIASEVLPINWGMFSDKMDHAFDSKWRINGEVTTCVRCVRLWLQPQRMLHFVMQPMHFDEESWGVTLGITPEGFLFVDSVNPQGEAARCGLGEIHRSVSLTCKLVIACVDGMLTLPTTVADDKIFVASMADVARIMSLHLFARTQLAFDFIISDRMASFPVGDASGVGDGAGVGPPTFIRGPQFQEMAIGVPVLPSGAGQRENAETLAFPSSQN